MTTDLSALHELEERFHAASGGHSAYLYATVPATTTFYVFSDGRRLPSVTAACEHLSRLLERVEAGEQLWW